MAGRSRRVAFCALVWLLIAISLAAPLLGDSSNSELLHARSPPMNPAGSSGSHNPQCSGHGDVAAPGELQELEKRGREIFTRLVLGDLNEADQILNAMTGRHRPDWQTFSQIDMYLNKDGWSEMDLSSVLENEKFMNKLTTTFNAMTVGHGQESAMLSGEHPMRHPSLLVWPKGPNRLIRLIQDKKPILTPREVPNGYYDVIYNVKDGIMIILRQLHPAEAVRQGRPPPRPPFSPAPPHGMDVSYTGSSMYQFDSDRGPAICDPNMLWFDEWKSQRAAGKDATKHYASIPPIMKLKALSANPIFLTGIHSIIVPGTTTAYQVTETRNRQLNIIDACLQLSGKYSMNRLPLYKSFGSFFPFGSWCCSALLALPPNNDIAMFLARHKIGTRGRFPGLGHKTIVGVSIFKLDGDSAGSSLPTLMWEIADYEPGVSDECAKAWSSFKYGEKLPLLPVGADASQYGEGSALGKGKQPATQSARVPEKCYPEIMKNWQTEAGTQGHATGGGTADDPMEIDDDDQPGEAMEGVQS